MAALARLPRPIRAVVFDMDGLLVDSEAAWRDAMMAAATARGRELPLPMFLQLLGSAHERSRELLRGHFGPGFDLTDYLQEAGRRAHALMDARACLKAGVVELLDALDRLGLPRAVCTSSGREAVERHLGRSGLLARFDAFITREGVEHGKPHPEPYLKAAEALHTPPGACLALEDSHNGVRSASAAGMVTVMVPDLLEATDEMHGLCAHVAESLHEVRALLTAED